MTTTYLVLGD